MRAPLLVLLLAAPFARADLFSPGELSKAHAALEGLSQCTECHPAGGQLSQDTCLACHQELQPRLGKGLGLHGRIAKDKRNCETCHHEHQGASAALIEWGPAGQKGFNHQRTGWALKGAHAETKCTSCHEKRRVLWPTALKLLAVRPQTMLGLGDACSECHFDEHRGQTEGACSSCHDEKAWKPAPGFDHGSTEYPLKGKHTKVKCSGCHDAEKDPDAPGFPAPVSETFLRFAPVAHRTCTECHRDPHEARFGLRCASCHVVEGWHLLRNTTKEREFHEKTDFPLKGAHLDVDCKLCHGPFPGLAAKFKGLPHGACATCHSDAHQGQLSVGGKSPDCVVCHTDQGFLPVRFGLVEHVKTRFPLEGAHQVVPCANCHPATPSLKAKVPKAVLVDLKKRKRQELFSFVALDFAKPVDHCQSCHDDAHEGQFKGARCETCHRASAFSELDFDHQKQSRFPLEGAHAKAACAKCHFASSAQGTVRYKPLGTTCRGCHADQHQGQFGAKPCETCHGLTTWKDLGFEHRPPFTEFLLDGRHAEARCDSCHREVQVARKVMTVRYRPLPTSCEGCHSDFHQGAFKGFEP